MSDHMNCSTFDASVGELALELLSPTECDILMDHASTCHRCSAELDSLSAVADRLVTLAPEMEPPIGFESRAINAMIGPRGVGTLSPRMVLAAAVLMLVVALGGGLIGRASKSPDARVAALNDVGISSARSAKLIDASGTARGSALITSGAHTVMTIDLTSLPVGIYHCVLVGANGGRTDIATWPVGASGSGSWTLPITAELSRSAQVQIAEASGSVVAIGTVH